MNLAQTIDPEMQMIARRSWRAILAQLGGEQVPPWCLPEPSAVQTSSSGPRLEIDDEGDEEALGGALPAARKSGEAGALI